MKKAKSCFKDSKTQLYKIVTINWSCATGNTSKKQRHDQVHYNVYITTLEKMNNWVLNCGGEVAENIVSIAKAK